MPIFKCPKCDKQFNKKSTYDYHLYNKKYSCLSNTNDDIIDELPKINSKIKSKINFEKFGDGRFGCPKCHNTYTSKGNAKRHYYDVCIANDDNYIDENKKDISINSNLHNKKHIHNAVLEPQKKNYSFYSENRDIHLEHVQHNDIMNSSYEKPTMNNNTIRIKHKDKPNTNNLDNSDKYDLNNGKHIMNDVLDDEKKNSANFRPFFGDVSDSKNITNDDISNNSKQILDAIYKLLKAPQNQLGVNGVNEQDKFCSDKFCSDSQQTSSNKFICHRCDKVFTRKYNLDRHLQDNCNTKNQIWDIKNDEDNNNIISQMKAQMDEMQQKIMELECKNDNIITSNNIRTINANSNNNIQTVNNDIKIIAFGKEDLYSLIDDEQAKKYLNNGYQSVYNLIEYMHFNPDKPELHSVYISNMFHPYAHQFDGERWQTVDKDEAIDQLFDDKACYLNAMFKELKNKLNKKTVDKYTKFMNDTDEKVIENIKNDIKRLLYNKRHIPLATKKKMGL